MSLLKYFFLINLIIVIEKVHVEAESLYLGKRFFGDHVVADESVSLNTMPNQVVSLYKIYEIGLAYSTINYIAIQDKTPNNRGGYANIVDGGLYSNRTSIFFWSQLNQPIDFVVKIYCR